MITPEIIRSRAVERHETLIRTAQKNWLHRKCTRSKRLESAREATGSLRTKALLEVGVGLVLAGIVELVSFTVWLRT
jgi:hypothetical protein